jgi:hypothetical protein
VIITYIRSSSVGRWQWCPHCYFCEYNLGIRSAPNKKADKGTIVHKVLEIIAKCSLALDNKENFIDDEIVGRFPSDGYDIDELSKRVYAYYVVQMTSHNWLQEDQIDCINWVNKALNWGGGKFDPRNMTIVAPEQRFDFEIKKKWAEYTQVINGEQIKGYLALKGTIDLVTQIDKSIYEIVDWKTGKAWDWNKNSEKTITTLRQDFQLRLYHYAASHIYPDIEQIILTINYINSGGPITLCFTKEDLIETELIIRRQYEEILHTSTPKRSTSWKCTKLCHMGKNTFEGTKNKALIEYREGKFAQIGEPMTICDQLALELQNKSVEEVTKQYICPGFSINKYFEPGGLNT